MQRAFVWMIILMAPLPAMVASNAQAQQDAPEIGRLKERQRYLRRQIDRGPRLGPSEPSDN